ncbi:helix-turn-helix transcriptional regulator [Streptomyces sp. T028]|uniref:helix-turn-helix transcriptional regulator n=1 Tax=Streptomyces sp. T028 TaxID=3394379 RepID=UPI003A8C4AD6
MNSTELGMFLKARRARLQPGQIGLPAGPRRRVPGLRRDEVARLAGMSVDYYIEIEQGRGRTPSESILAALSRALVLDARERAYLYHLAGHQVPPSVDAPHLSPALLDLLDRLQDTPAMILSDLHEVLARNIACARLLPQLPVGTGPDASLSYRWFTDPEARAFYPQEDHDHRARVYVSELRAAVARRGRDAASAQLIETLRARSPRFAALWDDHEVSVPPRPQRIIHPQVGSVGVDCHSFLVAEADQRLVWMTPADQQAFQQLLHCDDSAPLAASA